MPCIADIFSPLYRDDGLACKEICAGKTKGNYNWYIKVRAPLTIGKKIYLFTQKVKRLNNWSTPLYKSMENHIYEITQQDVRRKSDIIPPFLNIRCTSFHASQTYICLSKIIEWHQHLQHKINKYDNTFRYGCNDKILVL